MTNTAKPVLYKAQPHRGVVPLLTEDAYRAYYDSWRIYTMCGSWEQAAELHPELMKQLEARTAAGTFTFVEVDLYHESHPMHRMVYTGDTGLLDVAQRLCTVLQFTDDVTFSVPFSSGDPLSYRELLDQGWGPHSEEFGAILTQAMRAQVQGAAAEIAANHPYLPR